MINMNDYVTKKEAVKFLGIPASTLIDWEKKGRITTIRNHLNHRMYKKEDLEALLEDINIS